MTEQPQRAPMRLPRWVTVLFAVAVVALVPWTLWLTFSLPARHVTEHYDVLWVGFDIALLGVLGGVAWATVRSSRWLIPLAASAGTMLLCDAWFDVFTAAGGDERLEAIAEALLAELPLAAICAFIVYDAETFLRATVEQYTAVARRRRR
jgi:hypothetical protein